MTIGAEVKSLAAGRLSQIQTDYALSHCQTEPMNVALMWFRTCVIRSEVSRSLR